MDRRTQSAIHFETSIVAQHGPRLVSARISVGFSVGLEIAVALDDEVLGSPLKHLGSVANSHAARICDRASLRQRVVWAEGQTVLLQPMQVELPRLREQSCGTGRRRKPLGSRRQLQTIRRFRGKSLPGSGSACLGVLGRGPGRL